MCWVTQMTQIDLSGVRSATAALLALMMTATGAEARGVGSFHGGPRIGAWGRPLSPVRPGRPLVGRGFPPGFAYRYPYRHRHSHGRDWSYGYGLGGFGLGFGLGALFGDTADPYASDDVYEPSPVAVPVEVPTGAEGAADPPAAVAACARRFRTYDPATRTYLGKGSIRRPCP